MSHACLTSDKFHRNWKDGKWRKIGGICAGATHSEGPRSATEGVRSASHLSPTGRRALQRIRPQLLHPLGHLARDLRKCGSLPARDEVHLQPLALDADALQQLARP